MIKSIAAALALVASFAHAQPFQARDLTGDGIADAYYDTAQNLTWLADANYYLTQGNPLDTFPRPLPTAQQLPPGQIRFTTAVSWVSGLTVGATEGWRLPQRYIQQGDPTGQNYNCNETSCNPYYPWPTELSRLAETLQGGSGPFINVMAGDYMVGGQLGDRYISLSSPFSTYVDWPSDEGNFIYGYAWAVHSGDVGSAIGGIAAPVPEPSTYLMVMAGVACAVGARRRKTAGLSQA